MDFPAGDEVLPSAGLREELFVAKYGRPDEVPWPPRNRRRAGYSLPADLYEAVVFRHVHEQTAWLDVGGGHELFPHSPAVSARLANRCRKLVVVDPSANVQKNIYAHEQVQSLLEDYRPDGEFDLVTLRMVVEHVENPTRFLDALRTCLRPGGRAIVFTVNAWSPLSMISRLIPFRLHHAIKKLFWSYAWEGVHAEDTFPTCYRMNTRRRLTGLFRNAGFREVAFHYLDDLSTFGKFRRLNQAELAFWRLLHRCGMTYPENCLLGIYERVT